MLFNDLQNNFEFKYLLTRRLTQDCIKSLFSVIRAKGGNNVAPDSSKFYSAIRMCVAQKLLVPPTSGNCEIEACEFLTKCNDLLQNKQKFNMKLKHLENEYSLAIEIDSTFHDNLSAMNIAFIQLELHEENFITYIAGWACSKLNHLECLDKLATNYKNNISIVAENTFISMKEYPT